MQFLVIIKKRNLLVILCIFILVTSDFLNSENNALENNSTEIENNLSDFIQYSSLFEDIESTNNNAALLNIPENVMQNTNFFNECKL